MTELRGFSRSLISFDGLVLEYEACATSGNVRAMARPCLVGSPQFPVVEFPCLKLPLAHPTAIQRIYQIGKFLSTTK